MGRITLQLIRTRAEHNEGMVSNLEEVALHQQNIEVIEALGTICPHLKILYLQNNLIGKIQNLHKMKELEYLNLAVNNVTKVQNLQRCESLNKLDLTMNFVPKAGLLTMGSLGGNVHLAELFLMGNPCTDWPGYRQYVIATLPQLKKLDGTDIKHSERIAAQQMLAGLEVLLRDELRAAGVDVDAAALVEDDSILLDEDGEVAETGYLNEAGEMLRPWCPATRLLDHRENEKVNREAEAKKRAEQERRAADAGSQDIRPTRMDKLPEMKEDERFFQRNEGKWDFSMEESDDGANIVLDLALGKYLDTSLIETDVQPKYIRLLIKGKLLQLSLPAEVKPDAASAQRSAASGRLVITMPKERPDDEMDVAAVRPSIPPPGSAAGQAAAAPKATSLAGAQAAAFSRAGGGAAPLTSIHGIVKAPKGESDFVMKEVRKAMVVAAGGAGEDDDDDFVPDLR